MSDHGAKFPPEFLSKWTRVPRSPVRYLRSSGVGTTPERSGENQITQPLHRILRIEIIGAETPRSQLPRVGQPAIDRRAQLLIPAVSLPGILLRLQIAQKIERLRRTRAPFLLRQRQKFPPRGRKALFWISLQRLPPRFEEPLFRFSRFRRSFSSAPHNPGNSALPTHINESECPAPVSMPHPPDRCSSAETTHCTRERKPPPTSAELPA